MAIQTCSFIKYEDKYACEYCGYVVTNTNVVKKCDVEADPNIIRDFTKALVIHAKSGFQKATEEEKQRRLDICDECEHLIGSKCELCNCFVKLKTKWATTQCPIKKW